MTQEELERGNALTFITQSIENDLFAATCTVSSASSFELKINRPHISGKYWNKIGEIYCKALKSKLAQKEKEFKKL